MRRPVCVALGRDRITSSEWSRALTQLEGGDPGWTDLSDALRELRETVGPGPRDLVVALLPPLVRFRRIELPPLRDDEIRAVLARDAGRYLLDGDGPQLVGTTRSRGRGRSPMACTVRFANARLVDVVYEASAAAGWKVGRVVTAYSAWEAWARDHFEESATECRYLVIRTATAVEALRFQSGRIDLCRRFPPSISSDDLLERLRVESFVEQSGAELVAQWAPRALGGDLVPERIRAERRQSAARQSGRLLSGAAAMLLLSAGLELWGAHQELDAVRDQRSAIQGAVAQAMEMRETIDGLDSRLRALAAAESGAPRWSGVIADVAERLPADAHLIALRGSGDSLTIEGVAGRAAGVFESLQQAPSFAGARADAPIRQEAQDSAPPVERFSLGARLVSSSPVESGTR